MSRANHSPVSQELLAALHTSWEQSPSYNVFSIVNSISLLKDNAGKIKSESDSLSTVSSYSHIYELSLVLT